MRLQYLERLFIDLFFRIKVRNGLHLTLSLLISFLGNQRQND